MIEGHSKVSLVDVVVEISAWVHIVVDSVVVVREDGR